MTLFRKKRKADELANHAKKFHQIDKFFRPIQQAENNVGDDIGDENEENEVPDVEILMLRAAMDLQNMLSTAMNKQSAFSKLPSFQQLKYSAIARYFHFRCAGHRAVKASELAAVGWKSQTDHACKSIRSWAKIYLDTGRLPEHSQGRHSKRESLLNDEDIKNDCLTFLRSTHKSIRSPEGLLEALEYRLKRVLTSRPSVIS